VGNGALGMEEASDFMILLSILSIVGTQTL